MKCSLRKKTVLMEKKKEEPEDTKTARKWVNGNVSEFEEKTLG
jgi:hypothetical protein